MSENTSSQSINQAAAYFYANNPDFSLLGTNLYKNELLDGLNWDGLDRENILEKLRARQRILRLCGDEAVADALLDNGLDSAHRIAAMTEDVFAVSYAPVLHISEESARQIHKNAEAVKAKTMLLWANVKDVVASPHYSSMKVNNVSQSITEFFEAIPSYQELFGSLDFYEVDESKSILGPAAYFVDLMRVIDEYISEGNNIPYDHTLEARRPDLKKILLTSENTNQTVPYLQIVNEVLVNAVKNYPERGNTDGQSKEQDAIEVFQSFVTSKYPFDLPFNLPLEQIRTYLGQLKVRLCDIFEAFDMGSGQSVEFSREFLSLSREEYDIITTPCADPVSLCESFGYAQSLITAGDSVEDFLDKTKLNLFDVFMSKTGLDESSATQLFYLDLGKREIEHPRAILGRLFVNSASGSAGIAGIVTEKDANGVEYRKIVNLDFNKLDRINRMIRLSQKLGWSFIDLNWVLASIGAPEIDSAAIISIAKIKRLADKFKLPLATLCSFWYDIRTSGEGDTSTSQSPFDVIFNDPGLVKKRSGTAAYRPKASGNADPADDSAFGNPLYGDEILVWTVGQNVSADDSSQKLARSIVTGGIPAAGNNLQAVAGFVSGGADTLRLSIPNLSALYRHARLPKLLEIKPPDYLLLLSLLGKSAKKVLSVDDVLQIIETTEWMKKSKLTVYDLDYIINGNESPYVSKLFSIEKINQFLSSLQPLMKASYVNGKSFLSPEAGIDDALSASIFEGLKEYGFISGSGIVLMESMTSLTFKHWYKSQYKQIFSKASDTQADYVINKLSNQRVEQEGKLAGQLSVFFGAKAEMMAEAVNIAQAILGKYTGNWVAIFEEYAVAVQPDAAPDIIRKIMSTVGRYLVLAQKLKLKASELSSIFVNHFAYNINYYESLTMDNIKDLYDFKQMLGSFGDTGDGLVGYFQAVSDMASADDTGTYINKQLYDEKIAMFAASLQSLMNPQYLGAKSFISPEGGIDEALSQKLFDTLVDSGFVNASGVVLLENIDLTGFKAQYEVQYTALLGFASQAQADFAVNTVLAQREAQEKIVVEELAVFFDITVEYMSVLVKIASIIMIEHMQNCAQLFAYHTAAAGQPVSVIIKKFMAVTSLYLVIARKLKLEASQLDTLFLDNGVQDIDTLRRLGLDSAVTPDGFKTLVDTLVDKDGTYGFDGSFGRIKKERMTDGMLQALYDVIGWEKPQIRELCNYFFETDTCITLEDILTLKKCFDIADTMGVDVYFLKDLYACKDLPSLTGSWNVYGEYARKILEAVRVKYSAKAWQDVYAALNNSIEEKKRDKLASAAIWKVGQLYSDINSASSLYKYFLIDVEMSGEAQISYIKHALNSLQLYVHRCRMGLEKGVTVSNIPEAWWEWIMSYRVWEANRKVFLYPENYLDPSLRTSKTTLFKGLEESLMQSDITTDSAEAAFRKYLDDFSQLAKLRYVDSYYCTVNYPHRGPKDTLFLFARTQTAPYNYYYCTKEQEPVQTGVEQPGVWTEWKKIDLSINSEYISPVFAFNRLFIFWVEMKEIKDTQGNDNTKTTANKATIKYSFYNFSGSWVAPQTLVEDKTVHFEPDSYAEMIRPTGGSYPFPKEIMDILFPPGVFNPFAPPSPFENMFDMGSIFWKKVYAMNVSAGNYGDEPEGTSKSEKIAIMYGPFLMVASSGSKLNILSEPYHAAGSDRSQYEENVYSQALNYNRIMDFSIGGYLPLNDAILINASLQKDFLLRSSEFLTIGMNEKDRVFKPGIDRLNNALYVTSSDSIIHDNYIGEYTGNAVSTGERAVLFSSIFSSNAKIITVKNQPGMFIYDNGDETFLLTPCKGGSNENLFGQILNSCKFSLAVPIMRAESFVCSVIDEDTSAKICQSLTAKGIVDASSKVNEKISTDKDSLLLEVVFKGSSVNLSAEQMKAVKKVLSSTSAGSRLNKNSFTISDIKIDASLSTQIHQILITEGILDDQNKITSKYVQDQAVTILSGCLKGGAVDLSDGQIDAVKNVLSNAAADAVIAEDAFVTDIKGIIDANLSAKIFRRLVEAGVVDGLGIIDEKFYDDKNLLTISVCMAAGGVVLSDTQIEIVNDILLALGEIGNASFVTSIDSATSVQIFQCLKNAGILDAQGRFDGTFTEEELSACLKGSPLYLHAGKIRAVGSILSRNMSKAEPDSFIASGINSQKSRRIFNDLKMSGILDSEGRISQNLNRNIDLSNILTYIDATQRSFVKKVLLDLFLPVTINYEAQDEALDMSNLNFKVTRISTGAVDRLSGNLFAGGIDKLISLDSQKAPTERKLLFDRLKATGMVSLSNSFLMDGAQVDFDGPYGNYYWEMFFHAPMLVAMKLHSNQKFSDAQRWFKYIFDPTIPPGDDSGLPYPEAHHWQFQPFRNYTLESLIDMLQNKQEIWVYNNQPFDPHAIARLRLGAYEKAAVMTYIDNLIDWGDNLFAQYTWESITEATMLYMYAYDLLGARPRDLGPCRTQAPATFEDIHRKYPQEIPQFLIDLENVLSSSPSAGAPTTQKPFNAIYAYFSVPENRIFMGYWDTVADRLFKIRHSLNIKGEKQLLALFEPSIDPMQLVRAAASDNGVFGAMMYLQSAVPYYRFDYMLGKAKEITSTVIQLGASLLAALEQNDAEALSLLTSSQELSILNMTTMQREKQIEDLQKNLEGLKENINSAKNRYNTFKRYIDEGLNGYEIASQVLMGVSTGFMGASLGLKAAVIGGALVPNVFGLACGGMDFGMALEAAYGICDVSAGILNQIAGMVDTNGQYARRKNDWELEMKTSEYEINQIQKSIESTNIQIDIARQELAIHTESIEQSKEKADFLKSKFTSKDMYNWMVARVSTLYFQTYKLALEMSLQAQRAYQYEICTNDTFLNYGYWDSLKKGLLAGEGLMYSLQQMDKSYVEGNARTLEIEKTISLLQLDPLAFMEFKRTGQCTFALDEQLYDYDFPGHYCRQLSTVSISIPAVVGPYQNINAMLTQTSNAVILKPDVDAVDFLLKRGRDTSPERPETDVLRENWIMNRKVAISRGIDDSGLFELNFNDERYLPFEGTGAVSSWKLSMPRESNRINFDSISDVIIKIRYTALDGGEAFASEVKEKLSSTGSQYVVYKYFKLKQEFSNAWHTFMNKNVSDGKQSLAFTMPENVLLPNLGSASLQWVCLRLCTEGESVFSDKPGKGPFLQLTVKDTPINQVPVPVNKNIGIADEEQIRNVAGFTGDWTLEFDLENLPAGLISGGVLNSDVLKDMELVVMYEADPFGN